MSAASPNYPTSKRCDSFSIGATVRWARAAPVLGAIDPDIAEVIPALSVDPGPCLRHGGRSIANGSPIGRSGAHG